MTNRCYGVRIGNDEMGQGGFGRHQETGHRPYCAVGDTRIADEEVGNGSQSTPDSPDIPTSLASAFLD